MRKTYNHPCGYTVFLIGLLCLVLASCAGNPQRHLVLDASLVQSGQSESDIMSLLGPPQAARINEAGQREWYYYETHSYFWHRIPFLGKYLGTPDTEALQIVLQGGEVVKARYYVPRL